MGRVVSKCEKTIMAMTMMGTQRIIPLTTQMEPHSVSERTIASGLRLSLLPMSLGSSMLPMRTWMAARPPAVRKKGTRLSNWTRARMAGKNVASIEPIVGMKLSTKIMMAQNSAKSSPAMRITT